jgi:hypothetical protein
MLRLIRRVCVAATFLTALGFVTPANAVTGYVKGTWAFWNHNGNYCPSNNTCTGAYYTQAGFDTLLPVSNASIWVVDSSDAIIGTGSTDDDGNYTVAWSRSTFPSQIGVKVFPTQKDGRFYFANTAGQLINNWFGLVTTASSSSETSPQDVGYWYVGSSTAPDPFYNAYWAAEWQWRYTMNLVGLLQTYFTNVSIRGFADTISGYMGTCGTSCASGSGKTVQLDANAGFAPQARIMHELGHIASYVTHPCALAGDYTWSPPGDPPGAPSWCQTCAEWGAAAFEEAWATHYGSITLWADNAETPTTCLSSGPCYDSGTGAPAWGTDLEASSYPHQVNGCSFASSNPEARWPLSAMRYFWDVYDNHNDADGDTYSASQGNFWQHLANLAWYPEGTDTNQIDEPWNSTYTAVTEPDGRGSSSYVANYTANVTYTGTLWADNCSPP